MCRLGTQPVSVGEAEKPAQTQISISSDGTLTRDYFPDALRWHADFFRQAVSNYTHRLEELLFEDSWHPIMRTMTFLNFGALTSENVSEGRVEVQVHDQVCSGLVVQVNAPGRQPLFLGAVRLCLGG